jgi:hypothetical protein
MRRMAGIAGESFASSPRRERKGRKEEEEERRSFGEEREK